MEFSPKVLDELKKAGWKPGRNIQEELDLPLEGYPQFAIDFLAEFGNLKVFRIPRKGLSSNVYIVTDPQTAEFELKPQGFYPYYSGIIDRKLFPIGHYLPDSYDICCDANGLVYMLGEYCYFRGRNLYEGIENILTGNWKNCLQLDDDTGKWWDYHGKYVNFEEYIKEISD